MQILWIYALIDFYYNLLINWIFMKYSNLQYFHKYSAQSDRNGMAPVMPKAGTTRKLIHYFPNVPKKESESVLFHPMAGWSANITNRIKISLILLILDKLWYCPICDITEMTPLHTVGFSPAFIESAEFTLLYTVGKHDFRLFHKCA